MMKKIQYAAALCAVALAMQTVVHAATVDSAELDHPWTDGLYSTITGCFVQNAEKPGCAREMKLKVPGFKKELKVRASLREGSASLVVILNGTFARADNVYANLWTAWLEQAGLHVLTFDSVMSKPFVEASHHGVAGNLEEEARVAAKVVECFLKQSSVSGKVTQVGVVGISYGGTLALQLAKLGRQGALPFKLGAVQAYSAPVSFATSIRRLDSYFSFDYTKVDLYKTFYNLPREFPMKKTLDRHMMECALSRAFREDLKESLEYMDASFDADLKGMRAPRLGLPTGDGANLHEDRISYAEALNFGRYFQGLAVPYWSGRDAKYTAERLLAAGEMAELLSQTGEKVQVIVSANDPLNAPGAVEGLLSKSGSGKITVLPRGGHMGYFDAQWTKKNLLSLFGRRSAETAAAKPATLSYPR